MTSCAAADALDLRASLLALPVCGALGVVDLCSWKKRIRVMALDPCGHKASCPEHRPGQPGTSGTSEITQMLSLQCSCTPGNDCWNQMLCKQPLNFHGLCVEKHFTDGPRSPKYLPNAACTISPASLTKSCVSEIVIPCTVL